VAAVAAGARIAPAALRHAIAYAGDCSSVRLHPSTSLGVP
jgi:hypothetical protein